jgi:hypothetical protein
LNRWKNFFNQVLEVRGIHDVRQMDTYNWSISAIGKLKSYKYLGSAQILANFIKVGGETLYSEIHKLICSIWSKEELP